MPDPSPLKTVLPAGRHAICRCGRTANRPLCDGSHRNTGFTPQILDLAQETKIAWCVCRESGKAPMCDGTHRKYWPEGTLP